MKPFNLLALGLIIPSLLTVKVSHTNALEATRNNCQNGFFVSEHAIQNTQINIPRFGKFNLKDGISKQRGLTVKTTRFIGDIDLNQDGCSEGSSVVMISGGGSGAYMYFLMFQGQPSGLKQLAAIQMGDRSILKSAKSSEYKTLELKIQPWASSDIKSEKYFIDGMSD